MTAGAALAGVLVTVPGSALRLRPASYQQACAAEPDVCRAGTSGPVPAALYRPLRLPCVRAGDGCPVATGVNSTSPYVSGQQYGGDPVWMELGDRGDPGRGRSVLGDPGVPGWLAAENAWLVSPGYQGPFMVRGARLDGRGTAGIGTPGNAAFVEPLAFQIDGTSFSETIVVDLLRAGTRA